MLDYATLKIVHVSCVMLSGAGFVLRGALALAGEPVMRQRWIRIVPHVVDTLLLASAIAMAVIAHLKPTQQPWIAAKITLLVVYVLLGTWALRRARTRRAQVVAYAGALLTFCYIVAIALTRSPTLGLAG